MTQHQYWRDNIDPQVEPLRVLIKRGEWVDSHRDNRIVPFKIYYPETDSTTPLPVIIWSHGLGGTQDGAGFIARFLSAHGYVHIHIGHEGTNDSLWRGMPGHPWDNIRKAKITWETVLNRYLDVPFVLDMVTSGLDIPVQLDLSTIGMSGHSFGALTTQIMAGQLTGINTDAPMNLHDRRFKSALAYSPVPNARLKLPQKDVYSSICIPMMYMTGSEDKSPLEGEVQHLRDEIFTYAGANGAMQYSVILNGVDHMVFNGSRGQLPDYDGMDFHKDQIKMIALAWWDMTLKNDADATQWLRQNLKNYAGSSSIVIVKNND